MSDATAKLLQQIAARREQESHLFRDLTHLQSTYNSAYTTSSLATNEYDDTPLSHTANSKQALFQAQSQLRDALKRVHAQTTDESRLVQETLQAIKGMLKKRDRRNRVAAATNVVQQSGYEMDEYSNNNNYAHPATAASAYSYTDSSHHTSSEDAGPWIWSHDANSVIPNGSQVAALVDAHSKPPLWIQCSVAGYRSGGRPKYEVIDLDQGDTTNPDDEDNEDGADPVVRTKRYILDAWKIVPMPSIDLIPIQNRKEFQPGELVMAVFPEGEVTSLYPAEVISGPKKRKNAMYLLRFEDDDGIMRHVKAEYVCPKIEIPEE